MSDNNEVLKRIKRANKNKGKLTKIGTKKNIEIDRNYDHDDYLFAMEEVKKLSTELLKSTEAEGRYFKALNYIGILAMSEWAYTKEFTERVQQAVNEGLGLKDRFPK